MEAILDLWLPILLSSVLVFVASFILWTISPHHKPDWKGVPNEDAFLDWLRAGAIPPGQYMFPYCGDWKAMKDDPQLKARMERGPHGTLNVWAGFGNMGANMLKTFIFLLIASIFIAYVTSQARAFGDDFWNVFQIAGTVGVMAYCFAGIPNYIWFRKPFRAAAMDVIDGVIYAIVTGVVFAALWPEPAMAGLSA